MNNYNAKKNIVELMQSLRRRSGISNKKLHQWLMNHVDFTKSTLTSASLTVNVIENAFYRDNLSKMITDPEVIVKLIAAFRDYKNWKQSITEMEAVLLMTWTGQNPLHMAALYDLFLQERVKRALNYLIDAQHHGYDWSDPDDRITLNRYVVEVLNGNSTRPWQTPPPGDQLPISTDDTRSSDDTPAVEPDLPPHAATPTLYSQLEQARHLIVDREYHAALPILLELKEVAQQSGDLSGSARVYAELGRVHLGMGHLDDALRDLQESFGYLPTAESKQAMANLAATYYHNGRYDDARDLIEELFTKLDKRTDKPIYAFMYNLLGAMSLESWDYASAEVDLKRGLDYARNIDKPERSAYLYMALGNAQRYQNYLAEAAQTYGQALYYVEQIDSAELRSDVYYQLGELHMMHPHQQALAERLLREALTIAQDKQLSRQECVVLNAFGFLFYQQRQDDRAYDLFEMAFHKAVKIGSNDLLAQGLYTMIAVRITQDLTARRDSLSATLTLMKQRLSPEILAAACDASITTLSLRRAQTYFRGRSYRLPELERYHILEALYYYLNIQPDQP